MAVTSQTSANPLTANAWHELLHRDTDKQLYFERFAGEDENSLVQVDRNLTKGPGDQITFGLVPRLVGDFILGSSGLSAEGREQALSSYSLQVLLEEYKLAVRSKNGLDLQRPIWDIPEVARKRIMLNTAEKLDQLHFDALLSTPTRILAGDGTMHTSAASAAAACTTNAHKISPALIRHLKAVALSGGATAANSDGAPARAFSPIRATRVEGSDHLVLLIPLYAAYDLGENSVYHQTLREAWADTKNPIFYGGIAMVDNVVIHAHENMPIRADGGGAAVKYGKCVLMGAQALLRAYGSYRSGKGVLTKNTTEVIAKSFGYDEEEGVCTKTIAKVQKSKFNNEDYGSMGLYVTISDLGA